MWSSSSIWFYTTVLGAHRLGTHSPVFVSFDRVIDLLVSAQLWLLQTAQVSPPVTQLHSGVS